jgi:hypothetical protein
MLNHSLFSIADSEAFVSAACVAGKAGVLRAYSQMLGLVERFRKKRL